MSCCKNNKKQKCLHTKKKKFKRNFNKKKMTEINY